ncbi:MAG: hypothetical protein Q7J98_06995, partial [Kiritimatiellia bacterium]|nr:hypothetical protein [Kiritimatiellia bacterium]
LNYLSKKRGELHMSYENGRKWIEAEFTNGQYHGIAKIWRLDGTLFAEEHYSHGVQHGKLIWWYPDGKKQMEVDWIDGKKNGLWVEWDNHGNESCRHFKNDKPVE